ncbi:MAG: hypothetical protein CL797_01150 [Chromatiales bacterium]|nr:hypothetical protein [Chromatiales bacterium]
MVHRERERLVRIRDSLSKRFAVQHRVLTRRSAMTFDQCIHVMLHSTTKTAFPSHRRQLRRIMDNID